MRASILALFLVLLASLPVARAAVVEALDLPALVARAELIALGTTLRQQSRWDAQRRIVTDVSLRVDECFKGSVPAGEELVVTRLGGSIGEIGMRVAGEATFVDGGQAVVFLRRVPRLDELRVVGMSQGLFPVDTSAETPMVQPSGRGALRMDARGGSEPVAPALSAPTALEELEQRIRALVDR